MKSPLEDPDTLRKLIALLERQLAAHRSAKDSSMHWALKESAILDNLIMARIRLENLSGK